MRVPNLPSVREMFRPNAAGGTPPRDASASSGQVQGRQGGPLDAPPPLNVSQHRGDGRTLTRRRGGNGAGPGGEGDAVVVRTRDPHTEATQAQFHLQGISSAAGVSNDAKDGGNKIVDWFFQLLGITGTPR